MKNNPNIIPVNCTIPQELQVMLEDYRAIVNHLISFGIHFKVGLKTYYYDLASTDDSGKTKPIPPFRELRDSNKEWFDKNYKGKYAAHYLGSAASFAMQHIKTWRTNGGDITSIPHLRKPVARLDASLFKTKILDNGTLQVRVTVAPRKHIIINVKINHRHWADWSKNREGALVVVPDGLRLCYTDDKEIPKSKESVAYDFNFDRVVMARSDGEIKEVDLSDIMKIQKHSREKRISIQRTMAHNPAKAERLLRKKKGREQNRVNDLLHKKIHGKDNEIQSFVGDRHLGIEDLRSTTKDILRDDKGKKFNVRMSSWIHGQFGQITSHHHPDNQLYYTRGTSHFCPFCNSVLTHPTWKQSLCPIHGLFDRDRLEAVSGLVRTNSKHEKGKSWALVRDVFPPDIEGKLLRSSMMIRGVSPEMVSVRPECAILYAEEQSDIGRVQSDTTMQENRYDVDGIRAVGSRIESANDANFDVDLSTLNGTDVRQCRATRECRRHRSNAS